MDFAKRQLEKYGWREGQGLGKELQGIAKPLRPKIKMNKYGLDFTGSEEFTNHWWEDTFNSACKNLLVENSKDKVNVATLTEPTEKSVVTRAQIDRDKVRYSSFMKRETLTKSGIKYALGENVYPIEEGKSKPFKALPVLTDDQLFEACGGLTAHKGARHGLTLSGKLKRVKEQEEALLKSMSKDDTVREYKKKKGNRNDLSVENSSGLRKKKKKKQAEVEEIQENSCLMKNMMIEDDDKRKNKFDEEEPTCHSETNIRKEVTWTVKQDCHDNTRKGKRKRTCDSNNDEDIRDKADEGSIEERGLCDHHIPTNVRVGERGVSDKGARKNKRKTEKNEPSCSGDFSQKKKKKRKKED